MHRLPHMHPTSIIIDRNIGIGVGTGVPIAVSMGIGLDRIIIGIIVAMVMAMVIIIKLDGLTHALNLGNFLGIGIANLKNGNQDSPDADHVDRRIFRIKPFSFS